MEPLTTDPDRGAAMLRPEEGVRLKTVMINSLVMLSGA